jgi:ribosome maturation factor RimP
VSRWDVNQPAERRTELCAQRGTKLNDGLAGPFFFALAVGKCAKTNVNIGELLEMTLPPLGYELVDWEMSAKGRMVRVFIDKPMLANKVASEAANAGAGTSAGTRITVDDCARVSNHLTRLFTVENIDYERLEVSSPGLDRPLTKLADYARFSGEEAQVNLHELTDGLRRIKGILRGIVQGPEGDNVLVETDKGMRTIPFAAIDRGRLVPKIEWRKAK